MTSAHAILMTKKLEMTSVNDEKITYQTKINGTQKNLNGTIRG